MLLSLHTPRPATAGIEQFRTNYPEEWIQIEKDAGSALGSKVVLICISASLHAVRFEVGIGFWDLDH